MKKLVIATFIILLAACSRPKDVDRTIIGTWSTQWTEDEISGKIDDVRMSEEFTFLESQPISGFGTFNETITGGGQLKYNNFNTYVSVNITVSGTWAIHDGNKVRLQYDMSTLDGVVEHPWITTEGIDIMGVTKDLINGHFLDAANKALDWTDEDTLNEEITNYSTSEFDRYFKSLLGLRNSSAEALIVTKIDNQTMNCIAPNKTFPTKKIVFHRKLYETSSVSK